LFIGPDGGVITKKVGYAPPAQFTPVMEDALKKETKFQETLAKLKEMPDDVELNREIAIFYLKRQQIEKAMPISEKMPDDVELNREFGIYYLGKNEIKKALLISEKMPDDVKLNREFGIYYLGKNEIKKALLISEKMPDDVKLNREFGIYYLGKNEIKKALLISEKMPDDVKLNHKIAVTYLQERKLEKALPFTELVFEKDPKNMTGLLPNMHMQIGYTYHNMIQGKAEDVAAKNAEKAVMHFQKIIDVYPKSNLKEYAQYYLGATYSLNKQFEKSIAVLEKLMNDTTNDEIKQSAEKALKSVQEMAAEAAGESDN
jgi:tetratricopeptide (TPR) repeat protein